MALFAIRARRLSLAAIHAAASGHPGGVLSAIDIMTVVFQRHLRFDAANPHWEDRDRFVLSKGHAAPALYAVAALAGMYPPTELRGLRKLGHPLQGHPHVGTTPWVEASTGSLGQGFSAGVGMALGLKHVRRNARVYVLLGDGEMQEGQVWEALMCGAHHGTDNLCAILDYNKLQSDDRNENIMALEPLADKIRSFGWQVQEVDGHDLAAIDSALAIAAQRRQSPSFMIAHTIKGKGVPFMEGRPEWHGSVKLRDEDLDRALTALDVGAADVQRYMDGSIWGS